ncbi:WxcM-like domain-containing protein [Pseudopedobacter saltans DSM 12145]|uniref:WxcM-like domain-containing protein n=1 Tax=Pseudopedobacter saltans (strain ATCC 51119 / DSM 12145 / JCM 21818 / CCUG 39354 / LMG 10337 / NBRC 100064 / NCIMB 13643) TaxID=762903 RepID=F0SBD9_PSESL|nr:FdtA/QdtA family cupin domain-containing protein [Pseudopedobacter saltans]ADY53766.1 WxcM-like domain-containing protein [Pseudopedobacter saltans DSM 12145]
MSLADVRIIDLPKILDERGNLSFLEENRHIPFEIKRSYWIYDVPGGEIRGGHSYRINQEVIIALSGSFDVVLNDGKEEKTYSLNRSYNALYVPNRIWRHMENFSTNSLAFVVASTIYNERDYERDFNNFKILNGGFNI